MLELWEGQLENTENSTKKVADQKHAHLFKNELLHVYYSSIFLSFLRSKIIRQFKIVVQDCTCKCTYSVLVMTTIKVILG